MDIWFAALQKEVVKNREVESGRKDLDINKSNKFEKNKNKNKQYMSAASFLVECPRFWTGLMTLSHLLYFQQTRRKSGAREVVDLWERQPLSLHGHIQFPLKEIKSPQSLCWSQFSKNLHLITFYIGSNSESAILVFWSHWPTFGSNSCQVSLARILFTRDVSS